MNRVNILAAMGLALVLVAPATAQVTETFETAGPKDTPIASLTRPIGTFTVLAGGGPLVVSSPGYTNYGAGNNPTTTSILTSNNDEAIGLALATSARSVSLDLYLNDYGPATLSFFDGATLLQSFTYQIDAPNFLNQSYTTTTGPITRLTFVSTDGSRLNTGLDNIVATPFGSAVPEPATWALTIIGFGMVGGTMRHRRPRAKTELA